VRSAAPDTLTRKTVRRLTLVATAVHSAGFFNRIRRVSSISRSKCLRKLRMRVAASSVSSRTTRTRAVAVILRAAAAPTRAAAASVTPWAAATVPRTGRRTRGVMTVGSDPVSEPRQRAPAKSGEKRCTSVSLLGPRYGWRPCALMRGIDLQLAVGASALLGFQQNCGSRLGCSSNTIAHWSLDFLSA